MSSGSTPEKRRVATDAELRDGKHIHTMNFTYDETCQGGDPECRLWQIQLEEAMEAWS